MLKPIVLTATPSFTAPEVKGKGEDLVFELTVMDDVGATGTDQVVVSVSSP